MNGTMIDQKHMSAVSRPILVVVYKVSPNSLKNQERHRATIATAMVPSSAFLFLLLQVASSIAAQAPTVHLDHATVTGFTDGTLKKFLGMPYVRPPCVALRQYPPYLTNEQLFSQVSDLCGSTSPSPKVPNTFKPIPSRLKVP
jgi:hypothetical protein